MKTLTWQRSAKLDGVTWDLQLIDGRVNLWRDSKTVMTVGSDGETRVWDDSVKIPNAVVDALLSMNRVRIEEAGR
jgi:hypothetical protein